MAEGQESNGSTTGTTRVYGYRYVILFLFCLYSMVNAFGWVEYSIIHDIVKRHYNIQVSLWKGKKNVIFYWIQILFSLLLLLSYGPYITVYIFSFCRWIKTRYLIHFPQNDETVNWTALVYSVSYIPLIFPATWLMEKKGLRFVIIIGAFGTALGSWIKVNCPPMSNVLIDSTNVWYIISRRMLWDIIHVCNNSLVQVFSSQPHQFALSMVGQVIVACSQIFILSIPPRLAAVWFSPEEVSKACAIGVFGNQVNTNLQRNFDLVFFFPEDIVKNGFDWFD